MKLRLILSADELDSLIGIHATSSRFDCPSSQDDTDPAPVSITVEWQEPVIGPSPETVEYLKRLEKQREEQARAELGDNRSFFSKYWTYIVPIGILLIIFSSFQEQPGSSGGN